MKHTNLNNFAALISCVFVLAASSAQAKDGLKILIVGDMEGVAGAVTEQQLSPQGFEYGEFRKIYTDEVNAAIEAAFDGGAEEVVVADSHGNAQNLLLDRLNSRVTLIRGWPRHLVMMGGVDRDDIRRVRAASRRRARRRVRRYGLELHDHDRCAAWREPSRSMGSRRSLSTPPQSSTSRACR